MHSPQDTIARHLLADLLSGGPLKGAQLAQRLRRAYEMKTGNPFDPVRWGFNSFSHFLEVNTDLVVVTKPEGAGDIEVRLQPRPEPPRHTRDTAIAGEEARPRRLPAAIWQAFTNPDPSRRRFLNRQKGEVAHYREDSLEPADERARERITSWGTNAVSIAPIPAATQHEWMRVYLNTLALDPQERAALDRLLNTNYTSSLNVQFSRLLGSHANGWRRYRSQRVNEFAERWARENGIALDRLLGQLLMRIPDHGSEFGVTTGIVAEATVHYGYTSELRQRLHALIDVISDDEVEHVLVPLATVAKLLDRSARG